jgi:hypothetical protein
MGDRDPYFEELLREVAAETDPWRRSTPPLPDPARLLARARASSRAHRVVDRRAIAAVTGAFAFVLAGTVGVVWLGRDHTPAPPAPAGVPALLRVEFPDSTTPARSMLRALGQTAAAQSDPAATGKYAAIRVQIWSADTTPSPPVSTQDGVIDERLWWAADGSGRRVQAAVPPANGTAQTLNYGPGELSVAIAEPADQVEILAGQMHAYDQSPGPRSLVTTAAELFRWHPLGAAQRAALIQVLADTDGLIDRGEVTDRAGRHGRAVSVDTTAAGSSIRDILVFDPATGRLLDYEQILQPGSKSPILLSYTLFLEATRVAALP